LPDLIPNTALGLTLTLGLANLALVVTVTLGLIDLALGDLNLKTATSALASPSPSTSVT
jgi:hypothetical protein